MKATLSISNPEKLAEFNDLINKIESGSDFVKLMKKDEKKMFINIVERLRDDTQGELTDTEYESIAKMVYFCDQFETFIADQGVQNVETNLLDLYRKMKTQITIFMRDHREGKKVTPPSIQVIKNYLVNFDKELRGLTFDDKGPQIIDVEAVDAETLRPKKTDENQ